MNIIQKLLYRNRSRLDRSQKVRGLSTAELVGIIVIVGILGAVGGTYISGLVTQAGKNSVAQNANSLNTVYASAIAAGATTSGSEAVGNINTTSAATIIADLNAGIVVNGVTYQMAPAIAAGSVASYQINSTPPLVFSPVAGATTP